MQSKIVDPLVGRVVDDYLVAELLGYGGMSRVYRARDIKLQRFIALKVLTPIPGYQRQSYERFEREARAIARLKHPQIVAIHRFNTVNDIYYIAMEFVDGADLRWVLDDYQDNNELMDYKSMLGIMAQVSSALDYAHQQGVIHRDIKPSNIMIDRNGNAILTDFNLALVSSEISVGEVFGTAHYISPEQAVGSKSAVPQSDFYSLGVVLYEILTGTVPFTGDDLVVVATAHVNQPHPDPRTFVPELHPAYVVVLNSILSKEPQDRFPSGAAFIQALRLAVSESEQVTDGVHNISYKHPQLRIIADRPSLPSPQPVQPLFLYETKTILSALNHPISVIVIGFLIIVVGMVLLLLPRLANTVGGINLEVTMPQERFQGGEEIFVPAERELAPADEPIQHIIWSPDGRYLAGAGNGGRIVLWNAGSGRIAQRWQAHDAAANALVWDSESNMLATGGADMVIHIWNMTGNPELIETLDDLSEEVSAIAWSPDDSQLVSGGQQGTIIQWSALGNWSRARTLFSGPNPTLDWSSDGRQFVSGSNDYGVRVWNAESGASKLLGSHREAIVAVDWGPISQLIAAISEDGDARLWHPDNNTYVRLAWDLKNVTDVRFSHDEKYVAVAHNTLVSVWDVVTATRVAIMTIGNNQMIRSIDWNEDNTRLAAVTEAGIVRVWSVPTDVPERLVSDDSLVAHQGRVTHMVWDNGGERIASMGSDNVLRITNVATTQQISELDGLHGGEVTSIAWGLSGGVVATGGCDGTIIVIDVDNQTVNRELRGHGGCVTGLVFSSDAHHLWSVDSTGRLIIWNLDTFEVSLERANLYPVAITGLIAIDETHFATIGSEGDVRIWAYDAEKLQAIISNSLPNIQITSGLWNSSSDTMITGDTRGRIRFWDSPFESSSSTEFGQLEAGISELSISQDGRYLAGVDKNGCLILWVTTTAEKLSFQCNRYLSNAWSPQANTLVTGNELGEVTFWHLP